MKVRELITKLLDAPMDADVIFLHGEEFGVPRENVTAIDYHESGFVRLHGDYRQRHVKEFKRITGAAEATALRFLADAEWNLMNAVVAYYQGKQ